MSSAEQANVEIDESLYSRQLYVMGREAQMRMAKASVLIAGLNGLGVEVSKNVILAGVKAVTLLDEKVTTWEDLSSQFYLTENDLGKNRAEISVHKLAELNPYVHVSLAHGDLLENVVKGKFNVVVIIDYPLEVQRKVAEHCHAHNISVIIGDVRGLFGQIFCDFGEKFTVYDVDGEPAASSLIAGVTKDKKGLVTVLEETRHNLNSGDVVVLSDIVGMTELNGATVKVEVKDPFSFEIAMDTSNFTAYERGGYVNQIKQPTDISFKSFDSTFKNPGEFICDFAKFDRAPVLHLAFQALHEFVVKHHGLYPTPGSTKDADEFFQIFTQLNAQANTAEGDIALSAEDLGRYEKFLKRFAMTARGNLSPVCAQLGGVLGQEVLKACSGKFMPIKQWYYYDAFEALPDEIPSESDLAPCNSRYDGQIMVFGKEFQAKLSALNMFLVGAGAIGCEMLKNWAMMGIACQAPSSTLPQGRVIVTDMDQIEKSNLSRQFLFRNTDINRPKSTTAINAVTSMNSTFRGNALEQKVASDTEHIFNDDFYESLDMICTALDNVEARLYIDQKCLFYSKPMLESGTLGAKGHTQIVAPKKTENYGATRDPPEKSIPVCTLKHFPNQIEHTLQWGREWFEEVFKQSIEDVAQYNSNSNAFLTQLESQANMKLEILQRLKDSMVTSKPNNIADCCAWARKIFEDLFANRIKQLLHNFPLDRLTSSGTPFWSGSKKPPTPIVFDPTDPLHADFIISVANMRAMNYQIPTTADTAYMLSVASATVVPEFCPQEGVKIAATEEEMKAETEQTRAASATKKVESSSDLDTVYADLIESLPTPPPKSSSSSAAASDALVVRPVDFDKDIDSHMKVVAAASNLRARNYKIPEADLHTSRGIAGKITPAIATTTAFVTGSICIELYKLLLDKPATALHNTFSNLAIPLFTSMEPEPPKITKSQIKGNEWAWTSWDRLDVTHNPDLTVDGFIDYFRSEYQLDVAMISSGVTILFSEFMDKTKKTERKPMTLRKLVEVVGKKEIPANQKYIVFEIMAMDSNTMDDVEVPYVRFRLF